MKWELGIRGLSHAPRMLAFPPLGVAISLEVWPIGSRVNTCYDLVSRSVDIGSVCHADRRSTEDGGPSNRICTRGAAGPG